MVLLFAFEGTGRNEDLNITNVISLLGGVALFLFGMSLMGEGLKRVAGNRMELVLYRLSSTPVRAVLLGAGVTAIIQSSSATSAMVVGFVNSGMMKLIQAIAVIEGALIGTSVTGWIICLSSIQGAGWVSLLSTSTLSAMVAVAGIILRMFSDKQSRRHAGDILLGFAVLMFGMQTMSGSVEPLRESPVFIELMTSFSHPLVGIFAGAAFTAILQSASAAVGILQALSMTGAIELAVAWPLLLGIAIGSSVPVLLSALGARTTARRAAWLYLIVQGVAVIVFGAIYYAIVGAFDLKIGSIVMNPVSIAAINTGFRVLSIALLLPFNRWMIALAERLIRPSEAESEANASIDRLDERFLAHPPLAVEQSRLTMNDMLKAARKNFMAALELLEHFSDEAYRKIEETEQRVDMFEDKIGSYLVRLNTQELDPRLNAEASKILHTLSDFERISDHAINLADVARELDEKKFHFSETGRKELQVLLAAVRKIMELSFDAFRDNDVDKAYRVEPLEERIDELCDELKLHHVERLQRGACSINQSFAYNDLLTNLERVADHCSNVAIAVIELQESAYDAHDYVNRLRQLRAHHFDNYYEEYCNRFQLE
ncbi:MAG: Na/Pi cotransporter family protein [Oscillospiraceae bacterium]|nr:Na/Pi cotransporter family protein [Oscillospiraceae bacterium]